jgi:hypothetical protein
VTCAGNELKVKTDMYAALIIEKFFESISIEIFNEKAKSIKFDDVVKYVCPGKMHTLFCV